jgi:ADP-ribose pyrophosphatase YjhB (NUDIX family)
MPGSPCVLAALVLIEQDHKLLLVRESAPPCRGKWSLPGGRALPGESILQTAAREIREETGILAELTGVLYVDQLVGSGAGRADRIRFVFLAKAVGGALKRAEDEHSICAGWFSEEEIRNLELRSPFIRRMLDFYRGNPAPIPIDRIHVLSPEDIALERP